MNDKKNISVYLPTSFIPEIEDFIKVNNIPSRGEFFYAAARFYMKNSNQNLIEPNSDSDIKSMEELSSPFSNQTLLETIETSNINLIEKLDVLIKHIQSQNTSIRVPDESGIDILSKINNNLEKLLATFIDDKSSKTSETIIDDNRPTLTKEDDSWEDPKSKSEEAPQTNQIEQMARQARKTELRNKIKPMSHYTHLETYKDENSVIYQEVYKQYKLRYNSIPTEKPQYTFDLLNYMAPVLKTEKIYREFLERIEKAEFSKDKHNWQKDGSRYGYNLQKHLESLIDIQVQYSGTQKINLSNFIPYTIQEEKTSKKTIDWKEEKFI